MSISVNLDKLMEIVNEAAKAELLSRFGRLNPSDVVTKVAADGSQEIVTTADCAMEARLTEALRALLPASVVVGEEAAAANPRLLEALLGDVPVWVVDPLDGTINFASGKPRFGVMLALILRQEIVVSLIHLPVTEEHYVAERGAGAFRNGTRLAPLPAPKTPPAGTFHTYFAPENVVRQIAALPRDAVQHHASPGSAADAYVELAQGQNDFVQYYRLLPWDHAPGVLLLREAGGVARSVEGTEYSPTNFESLFVAAGSEQVWKYASELLGCPLTPRC